MDAFFRSIPVLLIFPTLAALAWIRGGVSGDMLVPTVPWLLALVFETLICFPQRHSGEDAVQARQRCWRGVGRDPVFFLALLFLVVVLGIPFLNKGLCPTCDYGLILNSLTPSELDQMPEILLDKAPNPPIPYAPFCMNIAQHFDVLMWFLPALTAMLAARHALLRRGKRLLVEMLVWNAAALAVFGFIERATGAKFVMMWDQAEFDAYVAAVSASIGRPGSKPDPAFFATFGYPNMAGCYFMLAFALSIGVWMTHMREVESEMRHGGGSHKTETSRQRNLVRFIRAHYALVAVFINFLGVMFTFCRAAISMTLGIAVLAFVYHICRMLFAHRDRVRQMKRAAYNVGGAVLLVVIGMVFSPDGNSSAAARGIAAVADELGTITTDGMLDRVTGKSELHSRVAVEIFKDYPLFGCGGWGYRHLSLNKLGHDEVKRLSGMGAANVHNDHLQFLCEHGVVGFGCLAGIFLCLVTSLFVDWGRLLRAVRFLAPQNAPPSPRAIYCCPPGVFWTLVGCFAVVFHACADAPMRSGAMLGLFFTALACADGYMPENLEKRR